MNLPDLKQLDAIITICRKRGVKTIKIDNIELTLSDIVPPTKKRASAKSSKSDNSELKTNGPTEEELLFWSVTSQPGESEEGVA